MKECDREDSRHGLPPMPGVRDPVRGGVRAMDDRRGTLLPGAAERTSAVQGVQGGDGDGIIGGAQYDTVWASGRG